MQSGIHACFNSIGIISIEGFFIALAEVRTVALAHGKSVANLRLLLAHQRLNSRYFSGWNSLTNRPHHEGILFLRLGRSLGQSPQFILSPILYSGLQNVVLPSGLGVHAVALCNCLGVWL